MSEEKQIQTLEKVLQIVLLSFELSNSLEETVPKPLIEDLKEVIEYCKIEGAELDVCVDRMNKFNKKVSFYEVFEEGGIVRDKPIAWVADGEVVLSDDIVNSVFKSKEECTGNGILDAAKFEKHVDKINETFVSSFNNGPVEIFTAENEFMSISKKAIEGLRISYEGLSSQDINDIDKPLFVFQLNILENSLKALEELDSHRGEVLLSANITNPKQKLSTPAERTALIYGNYVSNQKPLCEEGELNETKETENFEQITIDSDSFKNKEKQVNEIQESFQCSCPHLSELPNLECQEVNQQITPEYVAYQIKMHVHSIKGLESELEQLSKLERESEKGVSKQEELNKMTKSFLKWQSFLDASSIEEYMKGCSLEEFLLHKEEEELKIFRKVGDFASFNDSLESAVKFKMNHIMDSKNRRIVGDFPKGKVFFDHPNNPIKKRNPNKK